MTGGKGKEHGSERVTGRREELVTGRKKYLRMAGMLCLAAFLVLYLFYGRGGKGIRLCPVREISPQDVVYFCQQDERWANEHLGSASDTMASSGCLVCALASGLDMQAAASDSDFYITAGALNQALSEAGAYTEGGAVIWDRISLAVPGTVSYVADEVDREEIDRFLEQGICPAVRVRIKGVGSWHWVLLIGADQDGYLCMDPMSSAEQPVSLRAFGNRVYAMRAVYFMDN